MSELSERSKNILLAIIQRHIASNAPVGSFEVTEKFSFGLSPATIRNTMAELEHLGYVIQPYTSAGRIPTERGYRYYVNILLEEHNTSTTKNKAVIDNLYIRLCSIEKDFHKLIKETSQTLSLLSKYLSVVTPPRTEQTVLKNVRFIKYDEGKIFCIFISEEGIVKSKLITPKETYSQKTLDKMANYLNSNFSGLSLKRMKTKIIYQISREKIICDRLIINALTTLKDLTTWENDDMLLDGLTGTSNLPDFVDMTQIKDILKAIENKHFMLKLLEQVSASDGVQVLIGLEKFIPSMKKMSMVASTYTDRVNARGAIGIIGPTRMNYKMLIPFVEQAANTLTYVLQKV